MSYYLYMDGTQFPVTPSKIDMKIKGRNKTLTLINDGEINLLKDVGLTEISFDLLLPNIRYPFAVYPSKVKLTGELKRLEGKQSTANTETGGFRDAEWYLNKLELLKTQKKPFRLIIIRQRTRGHSLFETDISVSLEDYVIKEDVKQGFDVVVSVKLKQHRSFGTKIVDVKVGAVKETRASKDTSKDAKYTVVKGDCLWNIAKAFYGDGSKYPIIYEANKNIIPSSYMIFAGQVLTIPGVTSEQLANVTPVRTSSVTETAHSKGIVLYILFKGDKNVYGKATVTYTLNGKLNVKTITADDFSASLFSSEGSPYMIKIDKGSLVKVVATITTTPPENYTIIPTFDYGRNATDVEWKWIDGGDNAAQANVNVDGSASVTINWQKIFAPRGR